MKNQIGIFYNQTCVIRILKYVNSIFYIVFFLFFISLDCMLNFTNSYLWMKFDATLQHNNEQSESAAVCTYDHFSIMEGRCRATLLWSLPKKWVFPEYNSLGDWLEPQSNWVRTPVALLRSLSYKYFGNCSQRLKKKCTESPRQWCSWGPYKFRVFQHHTCSPKWPCQNFCSSRRTCSKNTPSMQKHTVHTKEKN